VIARSLESFHFSFFNFNLEGGSKSRLLFDEVSRPMNLQHINANFCGPWLSLGLFRLKCEISTGFCSIFRFILFQSLPALATSLGIPSFSIEALGLFSRILRLIFRESPVLRPISISRKPVLSISLFPPTPLAALQLEHRIIFFMRAVCFCWEVFDYSKLSYFPHLYFFGLRTAFLIQPEQRLSPLVIFSASFHLPIEESS
jgi:hypothetical protein